MALLWEKEKLAPRIFKNQLQIDYDLKCKKTLKLLVENLCKYHSGLRVGNVCLNKTKKKATSDYTKKIVSLILLKIKTC